MIDLYTWTTPNGRKVSIMLEECALPYRAHRIDIGKGEQFKPDFLAVSPNGRIPGISDSDGPDGKPVSLFESGAILVYLSGKTGRFLPTSVRGKYEALQWLMFQMGGVGPMFGQTHHFLRAAPEPVPYAIERYSKETRRPISSGSASPSRTPCWTRRRRGWVGSGRRCYRLPDGAAGVSTASMSAALWRSAIKPSPPPRLTTSPRRTASRPRNSSTQRATLV